MNTPKHWQDQHSADVEFARKVLMDKGEVCPMVVLHYAERSEVIPVIYRDLQEKQAVEKMIKLRSVAYDARAICMMAEGWMRELSDGELPDDGPPPSQSPDRIEVLLIGTTFRDESGALRTTSTVMEIKRGSDGKPFALVDKPGDATASGGITERMMLPRQPTLQEQEQAQAALQLFGQAGGTVVNAAGHA